MNGRRSNRKAEDRTIDDVEELLKATEDELLLDLSVGSHMSKVAPSYIDSDLNRRFQALKKPSSASVSSSSSKPMISKSTPPPQKSVSEKSIDCGSDGDDLLARFAALKGSRHSSAIAVGGIEELGQRNQVGDSDEVERIIQWAKDAARLDPSPPTDSDDSDNFQPSDVDEEDEDSEDEEEERKRRRQKKKQSAKKGSTC
ncbi:unnamed protein product [Rhodiola kirilowii]